MAKPKSGADVSPDVQVAAVPFEIYRRQQAYEAMAEAAELKMDQTQPGGVYKNDAGELVDANNQPVKKMAAPQREQMRDDDEPSDELMGRPPTELDRQRAGDVTPQPEQKG